MDGTEPFPKRTSIKSVPSVYTTPSSCLVFRFAHTHLHQRVVALVRVQPHALPARDGGREVGKDVPVRSDLLLYCFFCGGVGVGVCVREEEARRKPTIPNNKTNKSPPTTIPQASCTLPTHARTSAPQSSTKCLRAPAPSFPSSTNTTGRAAAPALPPPPSVRSKTA